MLPSATNNSDAFDPESLGYLLQPQRYRDVDANIRRGRDALQKAQAAAPDVPHTGRVTVDPETGLPAVDLVADDIAREDTADIDALLVRNLGDYLLGEPQAQGAVFSAAPPVLDASRLGEMLAGDIAAQARGLEGSAADASWQAPNFAANRSVSQRLQDDLSYNLRAGYAVGDGSDIQALAQQIDAQGNSNTETKGVRYALPVDRLSEDLGMDFTGFKHQVDADGIRHALKSHGDARREAMRGQIVVTAEDFGRIPEIVADYDSVELAGKDGNGNDLIRYRKAFNGTTYYVEEVRRKRGELTIKTL